VTDVFRVDLKAHDEASYKKLGGRFKPVLDTIELAHKLGYWVEVVTLVVPGLNHEASAVASLGDRLREIDGSIPWHINGFVPRYRLASHPPSDPVFLMMAAGSAYVRGSRFVYVGNVPACGELAHTRCPECREVVVRRDDYRVVENRLSAGGCPNCGAKLPGIAL
jgi:pyruvate formate lyase activating enzyme